jgi:hypothetical protein
MTLALQESGGLRRTAAVQSPVPVRRSARLSPVQRAIVLAFVLLLALAHLVAALLPGARLPGLPLAQPLGSGFAPVPSQPDDRAEPDREPNQR